MVNYVHRRFFFSNAFWFLLVTMVYYYPREMEAAIAGPDVGSPNSFSSSEEEASGNNEFDVLKDEDEDLVSLFRRVFDVSEESLSTNDRAAKAELPENFRNFVNSRENEGEMGYFFDLSRNEAKIRLEMMNERPIKLPMRLAYIAREYYQSWKKSQRPTKDVRETYDDKDHEGHKEVITIDGRIATDDEFTENIINAQVPGCPQGQRKDRKGKCRTVIW